MSRTRAIEDAAAYGALFVKKGLMTHRQLDRALEAVSLGKNFEAYILENEWVTEHEANCIREGKDPCTGNGNGTDSLAKQAEVSMNRMEAVQDELIEAADEFQSFGMSLLESVSDQRSVRSTEPLWTLPEELLPVGVVGEEE